MSAERASEAKAQERKSAKEERVLNYEAVREKVRRR
jgi:hypothetical protein